jgi:hypothetical protein
MKRILCWVIVALTVWVSCAAAEGGAVIEDTTIASGPLQYEMRLYDDAPNDASRIRIEYPIFLNFEGNTAINGIIRDRLVYQVAAYYVFEGFDMPMTKDYKCEVTLNNGKFISIVYWGDVYYRDHGWDRYYTWVDVLNIDVLTKREVPLRELFTIDSSFVDTFFTKARHAVNPETSPPGMTFEERVEHQDPRSFDYTSAYYLNAEGLVLSVLTTTADGGFYEAQLDYDDVLPFYRLDTKVWE